MEQLKLDLNLLNFEEFPKMWDSIPKKVLDFIDIDVRKRPIHDKNDKFYCSQCLNPIEDFYCHQCNLSFYSTNIQNEFIEINNIDEYKKKSNRKQLCHHSYYYVFDKDQENVFFYIILCEHRNYWASFFYKSWICKAYYITKNSIRDLLEDKEYSFLEYKELELDDDNFDEKFELFDFFQSSLSGYHDDYFQFYSLNELENTIFQYSSIWSIPSKYYTIMNSFHSLVYVPLFCPQFEYFIKMGFYQLAFECDHFPDEKGFYKILGVGKDYFDFIREYDLSYEELQILKIFHKKDISLIKTFTPYLSVFWYLSTHSISIPSVIDYFHQKNYSYDLLYEYSDYVQMLSRQGFELDHSFLYPDDLISAHDKLATRKVTIENPKINEDIKCVFHALSFNIYEDDSYIIYPASSLDSMIEEAGNQHNCLINYCDSYSKGKCQIYYLREKKNRDHSYVTIELDSNNHLVQARGKYNKIVDDEILGVIEKWQKSMIMVTFE